VERALAALDLKPNQAERLLDMPYYHLREMLGSGPYRYSPLMDGRTIPRHVFDPVAPSMSADVPMLIGSTETEVTWSVQQHYDPLDDAALLHYAQKARKASEAKTREVLAVYRKGRPQASNLDLYLLLATDMSGFRTGTDTEAERKAALNKAPVSKYYFNWYSPVNDGHLRSMHTMDIPFFLNNVDKAPSLIGDGPELQGIADRISSAIATFARTGNPNGGGRPQWDPFDAKRRATMVLGENIHQVNDPYREERLARMSV
jgi:para-nitrobenzyl esterase